MPALSKAMRIASAIAEHHPSKLYKRNAAMKGMTHQQLHDFAATKGLPYKVAAAKNRKKQNG